MNLFTAFNTNTYDTLLYQTQQVFDPETFTLHIPQISIQQLLPQPVLCTDQANIEHKKREDRCHKFINQDLQVISQPKSNTKVKPKQIKLPS